MVAQRSRWQTRKMQKGSFVNHQKTAAKNIGEDKGEGEKSQQNRQQTKMAGLARNSKSPHNQGSRFGVLEDLTEKETVQEEAKDKVENSAGDKTN